jgi:hypothetical protein
MYGGFRDVWAGIMFFMVVGVIASLLALFVGVPYLLWWLWENFDIVRTQ